MFSADLSWTEPDTEKIGQRKERIARERLSSSTTPSIKSASRSSKASVRSIPEERELWWASSLRKAKSLKPLVKKPSLRPGTSHSNTTEVSRKPSTAHSRHVEIEIPHDFRDPSQHPAWTYSTTISSKLPSGQPLDPPVYEVPELEGDLSSRCTISSGSRSSHERQWSLRGLGKAKVINEAQEPQQHSPRSLVGRTTSRSSDTRYSEDIVRITVSDEKQKRRAYSVRAGRQEHEGRKVQKPEEHVVPVPPSDRPHSSYTNGLADTKLVAWKPPPDWQVGLAEVQEQLKQQEKQHAPTPAVLDGIAIAQNTLLELTRFQRFIRRMETAGPKVILDRLKEEWHDPIDSEADEEVQLEKQLWVLTAFQLQHVGRLNTVPKPRCNTGKILELYGNLAEVYQLSAMHPRHKVQYLTTEPQRPMPLPGNVSYTTVPVPGILPFPYPDSIFTHIRASTLPSLVPSSELPKILRECHRLLAPGGMLEIRIMDAAPIRKTAGPKMKGWIEDRLSINLERHFRCSKPCMLVPTWVKDAGFELADSPDGAQVMKLPCAIDNNSSDIDVELKARVGRELWKNIWGEFVDDDPHEAHWWWEDEEVMQECLERQTVFECGAIFAHKK
ncbi:hypothetical protein CC80DRAFT_481054 [Byssothecium circinans]|uniref:Methyltransferase type 11 domain-containing protein n=1 Tax=Byssothecium circinans TaxID=147558 RepID=A0A6A5TR83_9PLEO|nr:hypothetical protein CC80DRAFT_481054 [Byssothecium circinans]